MNQGGKGETEELRAGWTIRNDEDVVSIYEVHIK